MAWIVSPYDTRGKVIQERLPRVEFGRASPSRRPAAVSMAEPRRSLPPPHFDRGKTFGDEVLGQYGGHLVGSPLVVIMQGHSVDHA
jgi:hypothetical protein